MLIPNFIFSLNKSQLCRIETLRFNGINDFSPVIFYTYPGDKPGIR